MYHLLVLKPITASPDSIFHDRQEDQIGESARVLKRFKDFRGLLEKSYARWHHVDDYAEQLGCAPKRLTRATRVGAGMNAKAFIASRINVEAKRL